MRLFLCQDLCQACPKRPTPFAPGGAKRCRTFTARLEGRDGSREKPQFGKGLKKVNRPAGRQSQGIRVTPPPAPFAGAAEHDRSGPARQGSAALENAPASR